ncbi:DUF4190 domain-containing protein, partial [Streptomyces antimicrobicus]
HPGGPPAAPAGYGYAGQPGYPAPSGYPPYGAYAAPRSNGFGVASLVLGILSVVGCVASFFGILAGGLAIVFGALGRGKASRGEADNGGVALAGLILGIVGVVLGVLMVLIMFGALRDLGPLPDDDRPRSRYPSTERV